MSAKSNDTSDREIVTTRVLNAPRELVFDAWTSPEHVVHWWGPRGFTITIHEMDVRPGGVWRFMMHGPDGTNYPNKAVFHEVVRPERLVYTHGGDETNPDAPGAEVKFHATVTFVEQAGKTTLMLRSVFPTAAERDRVAREYGAVEGATQHVDRLEEYLVQMSPAGKRGTK
jgi:uncharacterized protein YndB with AHSA1/START domain